MSFHSEDLDALAICQRANADLREHNAKLIAILEWLNRKGGLGLDVHERIREALAR